MEEAGKKLSREFLNNEPPQVRGAPDDISGILIIEMAKAVRTGLREHPKTRREQLIRYVIEGFGVPKEKSEKFLALVSDALDNLDQREKEKN